MPEDVLPDDSRIINQPPGFAKRNPILYLGIEILSVLLVLALLALAWVIMARREREKIHESTRRELEQTA